MTIQEIETKLRAAMDEAVRRGYKIQRNVTSNVNECCAIGAYGLVHEASDSFDLFRKAFKLPSGWIGSFVAGFDELIAGGSIPDAYSLGRRLAAEYVDGGK